MLRDLKVRQVWCDIVCRCYEQMKCQKNARTQLSASSDAGLDGHPGFEKENRKESLELHVHHTEPSSTTFTTELYTVLR